jgi:hypothetical protein
MIFFESLRILMNSLIENIYEREKMMNKNSIYLE